MADAGGNGTLVYAGFWIRVWAAIIDSILVMIVTYPLLSLIPGAASFTTEHVSYGSAHLSLAAMDIAPGPLQLLVTWVLPAIAVIVFWIYRSATPGKMIVSAKILDARTGGHPSTGQLIGRYFGYFISTFPLGLGLIWVGLDPRKQGWHDKLAHTVVVRPRHKAEATAHFAAHGSD